MVQSVTTAQGKGTVVLVVELVTDIGPDGHSSKGQQIAPCGLKDCGGKLWYYWTQRYQRQ